MSMEGKSKFIFGEGVDKRLLEQVIRYSKKLQKETGAGMNFEIIQDKSFERIKVYVPSGILLEIKNGLKIDLLNQVELEEGNEANYEIRFHEKSYEEVNQIIKQLSWITYMLDVVPYTKVSSLIFNGERPKSILPHNLIEVNQKWATENKICENDIVVLAVYDEKIKYIECSVSLSEAIEKDFFSANILVRDELLIHANTQTCVFLLKYWEFDKTLAQDAKLVEGGCVNVAEEVYEQLDCNYSDYQIIHLPSNSILDIKRESIKRNVFSPSGERKIEKNDIKMNNWHGRMLGLHTPKMLQKSYFDTITESPNFGELSEYEKETIKKIYEDRREYSFTNYNEDKEIYKILSKLGYGKIRIYPIVSSRKLRKSIVLKLIRAVEEWSLKVGGFFVGYSEMVLTSARPYNMDEGRNMIRISKDNMVRLGIEENDRILLNYRGKKIKTSVFPIEDYEQIKETNILVKDADIDKIVGVPVHLRANLGIRNINRGVVLQRGTWYIFFKNLNIQFLPTVALFFTLIQTFQNDLKRAIVGFAISLPFVIYIMLSAERSKLKK